MSIDRKEFRTERLQARSLRIPESKVKLKIPLSFDRLPTLPENAMFYNREGQAEVTVRYLRDTLLITATCDSLQQVVFEYERQIEALRNEEKQSERGNHWVWVMAVIVLGIIMLLKKLKK